MPWGKTDNSVSFDKKVLGYIIAPIVFYFAILANLFLMEPTVSMGAARGNRLILLDPSGSDLSSFYLLTSISKYMYAR